MKICKKCGTAEKFPSGGCKQCAKNRAKTPAQRRAYQRLWYAKNKEKHARRKKRYREKNHAKVLMRERNKEKRRAGAPGSLSAGIVDRLMEQQNGLCVCCQKPLAEYHIDHIMPLALGGHNVDENVQLLLPECNMKKGAKHPDDWRKSLNESYTGG